MNKFQFTAYMFLIWAAFCISGCRKDAQMYLEAKEKEPSSQQATVIEAEGEEEEQEKKGGKEDGQADTARHEPSQSYFIYVCGAVKKPGVYELPAGSRVYEAIQRAGGLKKDASVKGINQARELSDGDMLEILTLAEEKNNRKQAEGEFRSDAPSAAEGAAGASVIDINAASAAELMTLNGIGEAKAANIIAYRESNGGFSSKEEILNVNGIGKGVYANIQDKITVTQ